MISGVVGEEHVLSAWRAGVRTLAVAPDAIITSSATEAAARLGVDIRRGPLDEPTVPATDGAAVIRRGLYRRSPAWVASEPPRGLEPIRFGRVAIVGAGGVGTNTAHLAATADMADEIVLIDVVPGLAESVALDLLHASGITRSTASVTGGTSLELVAGSDVVVVTAGRPRSPGMSRSDLIDVNGRVVRSVAEQVAAHAPGAVLVVVTNPLDEMTMAAHAASGFPRERVLGMAGTLDSARFRHYLATVAGVDPADVSAFTLGSHGAEMVPVVSTATVSGRRLTSVLDSDAIARAVADTTEGGAAVVALRRTGSATIAPAHAICEVLDGLRGARAGAIPVSVVLEGEYGIEGTVVGVPALLGPKGVVEVVEVDLAPTELAALRTAADAVAARVNV
ncbi:hypothetical protein BH23ACT5_BH23ACT5_08900 [soil metagenome]